MLSIESVYHALPVGDEAFTFGIRSWEQICHVLRSLITSARRTEYHSPLVVRQRRERRVTVALEQSLESIAHHKIIVLADD